MWLYSRVKAKKSSGGLDGPKEEGISLCEASIYIYVILHNIFSLYSGKILVFIK